VFAPVAQVHNMTAAAAGRGCGRAARRRIGADLVPGGVEVGAVRISVTGWEGWVLEGLKVMHASFHRASSAFFLLYFSGS
jgi:hypothetical protein